MKNTLLIDLVINIHCKITLSKVRTFTNFIWFEFSSSHKNSSIQQMRLPTNC